MKDSDTGKLSALVMMVAVLLVVVLVQSAAIFKLHQRMPKFPALQGQQEARPVKKTQESAPRPTPPVVATPDPFNRDPFDWGMGDWDPFKEMESMHDRINQMFGNAFNRFQQSDDFSNLLGSHAFSPDVNVEDRGDRYVVTVDLPGVKDGKLDIRIEGQTLTVSGTSETDIKKEEDGKILRQERRSGRFSRMITLPGPVDGDRLTSRNENGVLRIEIPKEGPKVRL